MKQFQTEHWLCENGTNDCSTSSFPRGPDWYQHRPPASPHLALSMCYKYIPRWGTSPSTVFVLIPPTFQAVYICLCARVTGVCSSVGALSPGRPALKGLDVHRSLYHDISKMPVKLKGRAAGGTLRTGIRCDTSVGLPSCCFSVQHKEY